ncbi:hemerythrin domain-containing protein [Rhodococcus sp. WAY2]|uniref:hemerythrin domain-containing protein n=1 Tax=Rhodococcus sp. WAY2 TaxID=2663121 RepID=UPI00131F6596|nr:hemerythrin domain-containing protein [Rhodococcus sp. WAY2]QHE73544.1 hypothetical protein GFS60_07204 [Rhodococcus sp. WAY2]
MTTTADRPIDTRLINIVHDAIRRDLGRTFDTLSIPIDARRRTLLADHLRWTLAFLRRHHASEDTNLWPPAGRRSPSAKPLLDELTNDHHRVHHAASVVELAVCDYRDSGTVTAREYLRGALERLCVVLLPQLDREEDEAAPIVAATITSAEWDAWIYELLRTTSLVEFTWERRWLTDGLDAESRSIAADAFRICHRVIPAQRLDPDSPPPHPGALERSPRCNSTTSVRSRTARTRDRVIARVFHF